MIEMTKDGYCDAIQRSFAGWYENKNDYAPFVKYMLGIIIKISGGRYTSYTWNREDE